MHKKYFERWILLTDTVAGGNKAKFAEMIGMSGQAFQSYLSRDTNPGAEILSKLAGLGVNVNWFLTGEGEIMVKVQNPSEENERLKAENELLKKAIGAIRLTTESVINEGVKKKK